MYRGNKKTGFTLVEILIVVIILGILAAIVIPQFTNASTEARWSSTSSQLQTLRSQIELFKLQHGDALPDLVAGTVGGSATMWGDLTQSSMFGSTTYGPYMQQVPKNPMNGHSTVVNGGSGFTPAAGTGYIYDYGLPGSGATGKIWATTNSTSSSTGDRVFNEDNPADITLTTVP